MSKKKLSDFKPKTHKVQLIHPEAGDTGGWVEVKSARCNEYLIAVSELEREEGDSFEKSLGQSAHLAAILIEDWDDEFFECKFTRKKAEELMQNAEHLWIRDLINAAQKDQSNFFPKS